MRISRDKLSSWCWRGNMNKNYLMMFLLVNANFKSERFEKIIVERGQYIFSYDGLSRDCGMPFQTLRTTLKDLVKTNQITIKSTRRWSLLTICEYDSWQLQDNETNTQNVTQIDTQVVTQMDNNIINKEINNKENLDIKEESKKKEEELLTRLSELEKSFAELSDENRNLQEENEELRKKKEKKKAQESFDVRADLSYVDCFMDLWLEWLDYKDEIKKQYKTQRGAKSSFTEFKNLSHGNADKARAILDQSFRKSWDGLYDVKDWVEPEEKRDPTIPNTAKYEPDLPYDETMGAFLVPNKYPDLNEDWPYTPDNRPDGARICNGSNGWRWDAANKRWIEMLWIMGKKQWIDR